jgi:hypothetical protein
MKVENDLFFSSEDCTPGLPDGFFSDENYEFGYILEDLGMENVAKLYVQLEYFSAI